MSRAHLRLVPGPEDEIDSHVLTGQEHIVDEMVESHELITTCQARIDERRSQIEMLAALCRAKGEKRGKYSKHVQVRGTRKNIRFTWANSFKDIGPASISSVKSALGEFFDSLFMVKKKVMVEPEKVDELKKLLGKRYREFIFEESWAETSPDFRERRFHLLHCMTKQQLKDLDDVMEQLADRPRLSFK